MVKNYFRSSLIASSSASVGGGQTVSGSLIASSSVSIAGGMTLYNQVDLSSNGEIYLRFRPVLDQVTIGKDTYPAVAYLGIVRGYQLNTSSSETQMYFTEPHVPQRWDGASDITASVSGYLESTRASTSAYKFQFDWQHHTFGTDTISTGYTSVTLETACSSGAVKYKSFDSDFTIDYDASTANPIASGDVLNMRLARIRCSSSSYEEAGNIVVTGFEMKYHCDKLGSSG